MRLKSFPFIRFTTTGLQRSRPTDAQNSQEQWLEKSNRHRTGLNCVDKDGERSVEFLHVIALHVELDCVSQRPFGMDEIETHSSFGQHEAVGANAAKIADIKAQGA